MHVVRKISTIHKFVNKMKVRPVVRNCHRCCSSMAAFPVSRAPDTTYSKPSGQTYRAPQDFTFIYTKDLSKSFASWCFNFGDRKAYPNPVALEASVKLQCVDLLEFFWTENYHCATRLPQNGVSESWILISTFHATREGRENQPPQSVREYQSMPRF